ncbi:hypothetical protein B0H13DRAFT_981582 [Mycena leptocephala]|nr:hypothetical protein B0H13DRAFT_981582 [Mycena leptocephala]
MPFLLWSTPGGTKRIILSEGLYWRASRKWFVHSRITLKTTALSVLLFVHCLCHWCNGSDTTFRRENLLISSSCAGSQFWEQRWEGTKVSPENFKLALRNMKTGDHSKIPSDLKQPTFTVAARFGGREEFDALMKIIENPPNPSCKSTAIAAI